jgi:hypothetical protein
LLLAGQAQAGKGALVAKTKSLSVNSSRRMILCFPKASGPGFPLSLTLSPAGERGGCRGIRLAEHKIHAPIFISLFTDKF